MIDLFSLAKEYPAYSFPLAIVFGFVSDYIYAKYLQSVSDRRPFAAANWSFVFTIMCLGLTMSLIKGALPLICGYLTGGYAGTWNATKK